MNPNLARYTENLSIADNFILRQPPTYLEFSSASRPGEPCLTLSDCNYSVNTYTQMLRGLKESTLQHPANASTSLSIRFALLHVQVVERLGRLKQFLDSAFSIRLLCMPLFVFTNRHAKQIPL
ncbi:hypothetical protein M408DRAFT_332077 [Serendipita vermifera MAFF 305830]|uniref:Uncharacterized protein n=1 Tax=Serendipita vermifera MAFF 305830 TaxID=933852 RepID=A0A0C2WBQ8_SERVB|nr:hypothetical protein M408DRAFT_332077 [Serendipita vermifera MAFF 305830]